MNALPGAAVTSEPWGRGDVEIFMYLLRPQFDSFLGGKQRVTAAAPHAVKFHNTPRTRWGDLASVFCCSTAFLLISKGKRLFFCMNIILFALLYNKLHINISCHRVVINLRMGTHMTRRVEEKSHSIKPHKQTSRPIVQSQICAHPKRPRNTD